MAELDRDFREKSLRDGIEGALRQWILSGRLKPGQRIREQEICDELDVSRTALREAFPRLEVDHLIINSRTGRSVIQVTIEHVEPLRDTSLAIWSLIIQGFCENASKNDVLALRDALNPDDATLDHRKARERAFFQFMSDRCANDYAAEFARQLEDRREMMEQCLVVTEEFWTSQRERLGDLLMTLEARDPEKAMSLHSSFLGVAFEKIGSSLAGFSQVDTPVSVGASTYS